MKIRLSKFFIKMEQQWFMFKRVIRLLTDEVNGTLFGGAVRDWKLRDIHTERFREEQLRILKEYKEYKEEHDHRVIPDHDDHMSIPKTRGRLMLPHDIDMFIHKSEFGKLIQVLSDNNFIIDILPVSDLWAYPIRSSMKHYIINITTDTAKGRVIFKTKIDLVCLPTWGTKFPLDNLDFNVNGLLYNRNEGFHRMNIEGLQTIDEIYDSINRLEAVPVRNDVPKYRIEKMQSYGWNIVKKETDKKETDKKETDKKETDKKETDKKETDKKETDKKEEDKKEEDKKEEDKKEEDKKEEDKKETDKKEEDKKEEDKKETDKKETDKKETDKKETDKKETDKKETDKKETDKKETDKEEEDYIYI